MPSPLIHLLVAEKLSEKYLLEASDFYFGNIVPDAHYIRERKDFREQKTRIHFIRDGKWDLNELFEYYSAQKERDSLKADLLFGYVTHIITDYIWWDDFYKRIFHEIIEKGLTSHERNDIYYKELARLDAIIIEENNMIKILELIDGYEPCPIEGLLSIYETRKWKQFILHKYSKMLIAEGENAYLTRDKATLFVDFASEKIESFITWGNLALP